MAMQHQISTGSLHDIIQADRYMQEAASSEDDHVDGQADTSQEPQAMTISTPKAP